MREITIEEFKEICTLTVELTKLRQNECKHLCIENLAPQILRELLIVVSQQLSGQD